jgi:hypothetical protein
MIAVLVPTHAHVNAWYTDNRADIVTAHRVKNEFNMKDGTTCRLIVVQGTIDIMRLQGYDWEKIVITYGDDKRDWRDNCTLRVRQNLNIDPARLEYKQ